MHAGQTYQAEVTGKQQHYLQLHHCSLALHTPRQMPELLRVHIAESIIWSFLSYLAKLTAAIRLVVGLGEWN